MRAVILGLTLFVFVGCANEQTYEVANLDTAEMSSRVDTNSIEYLLEKSNKNIHVASVCDKKSDSATEVIVQKTIKERQWLKQLSKIKEKVIIKDTVYIETKTSFWGKKKTNITRVSDSVSIVDTKVDTVK